MPREMFVRQRDIFQAPGREEETNERGVRCTHTGHDSGLWGKRMARKWHAS